MSGKPFLRDVLGRDIPPIVVCDIGAMSEGAPARYERLLATDATLIGFEPNPAELAKLNAQPHPKRRYFPYFLGNGSQATFRQARYPGCSSLFEPDAALIGLFTGMDATDPRGNFTVTGTESIQTHRLDDVPDLPAIDLLKLDIQGSELDVLRNGARTLANALIVECEVEFIPLYKDQPVFGDVHVFLRDRGFAMHKLIDVAGRCFRPFAVNNNVTSAMSQVLWADAIFVRDFMRLDRYGNDELLKGATILYEVYDSHDLAHLLLSEHDRRAATSLAPTFLNALRAVAPLPTQYLNQKIGG